MNGDQSKPLMWGHVTRPPPIRGRGNSHVGASRAPRFRDGAEPVAGAAAVTAGAEQSPERLKPGQSPVTPAEKPELGPASALCYRLGCKISLF